MVKEIEELNQNFVKLGLDSGNVGNKPNLSDEMLAVEEHITYFKTERLRASMQAQTVPSKLLSAFKEHIIYLDVQIELWEIVLQGLRQSTE